MASRGPGYDYGTGGSGAGGKIRRRPSSRAALSPYARPAPAPAASQGGGWFSRLISAGASRLLPSLFRKMPPQLAAPPPPPEPVDTTHSRPEAPQEPLLLRQDLGPAFVRTQPELPDVPPSPPPPPLEDDFPEGEERGRAAADNLPTESSAKNGEDMLRNSDEHGLLNLENLLKQRTFKRREFEYLSELLWSRTVGSNSLKSDDGNINKIDVSDKEIGSMHSNLPVDFSVARYDVTDIDASPAEIAKAYMGSKSVIGSSLRLRLHDSSSLAIKSMEANMIQQARPPTIPLQGSRLNTSNNSDSFKRNFSTPNRSAIYKMSQTPYFKSAASADDLFSNVSSSHRTPSSVHTYGRQVLKRKSSAVNNEMVSVGPIRKMHHRYSRTLSLLETPTGYRGHLASHASKLNKYSQTQKRQCLSKVGDAALGGLDDKTRTISFGQAPKQSADMAAKILKQLDTLVPSQKEGTSEIKQKHGIVMDVDTHFSQKKDMPVQSNQSEPSTSGVKDFSLLNGINGNVTVTPAHVTEKSVDATSNTSASTTESISQFTSLNVKPPAFSSRSYPPNLVLSSEVDRNKMSITSNGTPTMASPPVLSVEKLQTTASSIDSVTSEKCGSMILKSVSNEGSVAQKADKLSADYQLISSKSSGQVTSFTCNPVFKFSNAKLATSSNGLQHTSNSMVSDILPARASSQNAGSFSTNLASVSALNVSTGGGLTISSSGTGSLSAAAAVTGATAGSGSATAFTIFPQLGTASSQGTTKAMNNNTPFNFSQQFGIASSFSAQDKSKAAFTESVILSGNQNAQPRNSNAPLSDPSSGSSLFSSAASGSISVTAAVSAYSPISSFATGSGPASTGLQKFGSDTSPLSSAPSAVFSFTAATPSIPNSGPTTPIFGGVNTVTTSITGTGQMNAGSMITDRKESPFSTASPFGIPSNSPSTPIFSSPASQFTPTTTASPEIFKFGEQNGSSGAFSIGSGGGNEKSGRKFIRVKRRK